MNFLEIHISKKNHKNEINFISFRGTKLQLIFLVSIIIILIQHAIITVS